MPNDRVMKEAGKATLAGVQKEMAKSRVAKSARKKYAHLDSAGRMANERTPAGRKANENPRKSQS
jgi:hypothetical protein